MTTRSVPPVAGTPNRRTFLMGCSAAIAAMSGASVGSLVFGDEAEAAATDEVLVVIFLRGAWDALNVVPPIAGADRGHYEAARPYIKIPLSGKYAARRLDARFGLHPALDPLVPLFHGGHLAIVHAVGMNDDTRSHFDAMQFMEAGTPGQRMTAQGWLTRHLETLPHASLLLPSVSMGGSVPASLLGSRDAVAMTTPSNFGLPGDDLIGRGIGRLYRGGDSWLHHAGQRTLAGISAVQNLAGHDYKPPKGITYPNNDVGTALAGIAQLMRAHLPLRAATIDVGGWDTHQYQGDGGQGYLADLLSTLASGLAAFYADMAAAHQDQRVTVVTMSEFGRRLNQNASGGTDHGHGSTMFVLGGGSVRGGRVYGRWPGLRNDQLYDQADLAVTTDYRQVLGEILSGRLGNSRLSEVFPGFTMGAPLGLVRSR